MTASTLHVHGAVLGLALLGLAGCSATPTPRPGSHPWRGDEGHEDPVEVPTPPPPGKVAVIPPKPPALKDPVWVDGQWTWSGRGWVWKEGGWEEQPPDKYYAPPISARLDDGTLVYKPGRWSTYPAKR